MSKSTWTWALAVLFVVSGCSDPSDNPNDDGGAADAGSDRPDAGETGPADTQEPGDDTDRQPEDIDTSWDLGLSDTGDSTQPLSLDRVVPPSGPVEGGNRVRIVGGGLTDDLEVYFGSRKADFELSGGALVREVPAGSGPGPVTVKAVAPDDEAASIPEGYEYVAGVQIDRISPRRIPVDGGTEVTIEGSGFREPTAVSFAGVSARRLRRVSSEKLRAVAPSNSRGPADVRVTTRAESEVREDGVEYFEPLKIGSIRPAAGPTAGGTVATLEVDGLGASVSVEFGGSPATVRNVDRRNGEVEVETPAHAAGLVDVSVRSAGDAALRSDAFLYRDSKKPKVGAIDPAYGPATGGTEVELIGQGLAGSNVSVEFGGSPGTILEAKLTFIRVETPVGSPGAVDVEVKDGSTTLGQLDDGFEYRKALEVSGARPGSGPVAGGTQVTIQGSGFQNADEVYFGGLPASFSVKSDAEIQASAPAHGAGSVDIRVERNGLEGRLEDGFVYTTDLEVWGFEPVRGAVAGGTYVEVRGRGFVGTLEVEFDGDQAQKVRRIDRNNLYLYTPSHDPGETPVTVRAASKSAQGPYPFEFFDPVSRYGGASGGKVEGAVNVTVLAQGGGPIPEAFVMLSTRSDTEYTGTTDGAGQVTLSGPSVRGPQTVTAAANGFTTATVREVNAENVTVFLRKLNPEAGGGGGGGQPPSATITGSVRAPYKLADPDRRQTYDMAVVKTTKESIFARRPDPGEGSVVVGEGDYEINSRVGDLAVVAFCGAYDESTEEFEPQYIGVERYLNISDGDEKQADLVCDIPLDRSVQVKLQNPIFAPRGPDTNVAEVYWDFGFEGVLEAPTGASGLSSLLEVENQPPLEGKLSDVTLTVEAGSFTGRSSSPSSRTRKEGISSMNQPVVMPPLVDVPEPLSPKSGEVLSNNEIRFQAGAPHYGEMYNVYLLNQQGRPFWQYVMAGDETTVKLPEFPDFSYLPPEQRPDPYKSGRAFVLLFGIDAPGADFDSFTYRDLSLSAWRGYSTTRWGFEMP